MTRAMINAVLCGGPADGQRLMVAEGVHVLQVPEMRPRLTGFQAAEEYPTAELSYFTYRMSTSRREFGGVIVWQFVVDGLRWPVV